MYPLGSVQKALLPHLISGLNSLQLIKLKSNFTGENRVTRSDHNPSKSLCPLQHQSQHFPWDFSLYAMSTWQGHWFLLHLPFPPQQECKTQGKVQLHLHQAPFKWLREKDPSNHMHTLLLQWQVAVPFVVMCGASDSTPLQTALQPNPKWLLQALQSRIPREVPRKGEKRFGCCTFTFQEHKIHEKGKPNHRQSQMGTFYQGFFYMFCIKKEKKKKVECKEWAIPTFPPLGFFFVISGVNI